MFHQKSSLRVFTAVVFCLFQTHVCRGQPHSFGTPQPIVAALGDDVMLPCHLEPAQDAEGFTLEWTRPDLKPRFVHVWRSGVELQDKQHPHYRGRTALFIDELKHGNISLKLVKVKPADEGTYRCYIPSVDQQSFVQVLIAAASSPFVKLVGIHKPSGSVVLECTSSGWYPEPEVSWMDAEEHLVPAGPPETVQGPDDLYTVSSRVTVDQSHGSTVTCRVHQDRTNQTKEAQIRVPDDFFMFQPGCSTITQALAVSLAVVTTALISLTVFVLKTNLNKHKTKETHQRVEMKTHCGPDKDRVQYLCKDEEQDLLMKPEPVDNGGKKNETEDSVDETNMQSVLDNEQKNQEPEEKQHSGGIQVPTPTLWNTITRFFSPFGLFSSSTKQRLPTDQQTTDKHMEEQIEEEQKEETNEDLKSVQPQLEEKDSNIDQLKRHVDLLKSDNTKLQQELDMKNKEVEQCQQRTDQLMEDLKRLNDEKVKFMTKYQDEKEQREKAEKELQSVEEKLQFNRTEIPHQHQNTSGPSTVTVDNTMGRGVCLPNPSSQFMTKYQDEKEQREKAEKELQSVKEKLQFNRTEIPHPHQNTSGPPTVTVDKIDPLGREVCLRNSSKQVQPMGGWTLIIKTDSNEPIKYTFGGSVKLQPGKTITILADGFRGSHDPITELVWNGQKPWRQGQEVCVTVCNKRGQVEDSKCERLNQSEQNRTDQNRTDVTRQSSETGPDIKVKIDENGKYICLQNRSNKNLELEGWKITAHTEKRENTYTFKKAFTLTCGQYVTIWASGCGVHAPPSSLLWKELKPWDKGTTVDVTLHPPDHKVKSVF